MHFPLVLTLASLTALVAALPTAPAPERGLVPGMLRTRRAYVDSGTLTKISAAQQLEARQLGGAGDDMAKGDTHYPSQGHS